MCRKEDIFRQRRLNHYDIGVGRGKDNWTHHASIILQMEDDLWMKKYKNHDLNNEDDPTACTHSTLLCGILFGRFGLKDLVYYIYFGKVTHSYPEAGKQAVAELL